MTPSSSRSGLRALVLWTLLAPLGSPAAAQGVALEDLLKQGFDHVLASRFDQASAVFDDCLARAHVQGDTRSEAEARLGRGQILTGKDRFSEARDELNQALPLFERAGDLVGLGKTYTALGIVEHWTANLRGARSFYEKALAAVDAAGDRREKASVLRNLSMITNYPESLALIQQAWEAVRPVGDPRIEGRVLHHWGDVLFGRDYRAAFEKVEAAVALLDQAGDKSSLARALTSLGRLQRVHGQHEAALDLYRRALALQEELGDRKGMAQSLGAIAVALRYLKRNREAVPYSERAAAVAREAGLPLALHLKNLGAAYLSADEPARALSPLEEASALGLTSGSHAAELRSALAHALSGVGRHTEALAQSAEAVALARRSDADTMVRVLTGQARLRERLGQLPAALADAREALAAVEQWRGTLAPHDFLKRGFGDQHQDLYAHVVHLLDALDRPEEALEVAEQARARAFQDLLAASAAEAQASPIVPGPSGQKADPTLPSLASAPPPSLGDITGIASSRRSTLVSYWVGEDSTLAWVVTPDGRVRRHRLEVKEARLAHLVRRATSGLTGSGTRGGPGDEDPTEQDDDDQPVPAARPLPRLTLRGGDEVTLDGRASRACRALYDLLVRPLREDLPPGGRVTIVPHGPLFKLSFAALQDEKQRYLVESYSLHYTPSVGALRLTGAGKGHGARGALLVADPALPPAVAVKDHLGSLPGARREADEVARLLGRREATLLVGAQAREDRVRRLIADKAVIHFATHGVVRDADPLGAFLGLAGGGPSPPEDGRLTAAEIHRLSLSADLVFLSACRTAGGHVSGDGVVGLTRAFLAAGAPSVVATLWDVSDEVARHVVRRFYPAWRRTGDKAAALRQAQLAVLQALRRGELKVATPAGRLTLPEHPALWAPFTLQGAP